MDSKEMIIGFLSVMVLLLLLAMCEMKEGPDPDYEGYDCYQEGPRTICN
jgi:hypothetical protein